ncbi:EF-hand domain-containing protein [Rhizorhapis sp. SPR117]|uniref:EF-hand domain-containing protein n=1 Tax=Rhizorhapis sp. SPR117 TaxID=2912611 RepID=UPI001F259F8E|nr:EF-hand domain-containing protein [Rhizorhapis sp. SPR117]
MKKKLFIGTALGGMIVAGTMAVAATAGHGPMRADTNGDGNLTKAEVVASLDKRFAELDTNGDGKITQDERKAKREARFEEHFKAMDKDGNGQISKTEMKAAHEARMEKRGDHMGKRGHDGAASGMGGHHKGMWRGHGGSMAMTDADKDGVVTKAEFQARALKMFAKADADNDGTVTKAEREAVRNTMMKMRQNKQPAN